MNFIFQGVYNLFFWPLIKCLSPVVIWRWPNGKIAATLKGQRQACRSLQAQLQTRPRQKDHSCVWFHVASAGEFLQARPVMDLLKAEQPHVQILLSYVSPSAVRWVQDYKNADWKGYAPFDTLSEMREWLGLIQPQALVLVKFDLWPNMVRVAKEMKLATLLISATLSENSGRFRNPFVRAIFRQVYADIDHILCVGVEDRERFLLSNPQHPDLRVVGDTRVDSVLARQKAASEKPIPDGLKKLRLDNDSVVIVGSSWPRDEELILPSWQRWRAGADRQQIKDLLIMAPHEPDESHLRHMEKQAEVLGLSTVRYSQLQNGTTADVILIDRMGLLADLYRIGDLAFVGSGDGGVHNTMEPAAWKLPVAFRPVYHNAPEAIALVKAGLFQPVATVDECVHLFENWLKNLQEARTIGQKGREFLDKSQGATYTCYESLKQEL